LYKLVHSFFVEKVAQKYGTLLIFFDIFIRSTQRKNYPIGENSPNLVTLNANY
jgi:hypothetical protein